MVKLGKNAPLYFLNIRGIYPRIKSVVVSFPLDKKLFNAVCVMFAQYFIYFNLCLVWYNDFPKLVFVNLAFNGTIL